MIQLLSRIGVLYYFQLSPHPLQSNEHGQHSNRASTTEIEACDELLTERNKP